MFKLFPKLMLNVRFEKVMNKVYIIIFFFYKKPALNRLMNRTRKHEFLDE